jgi:hypothetical protein
VFVQEHALALADAIGQVLPAWVVRSVRLRLPAEDPDVLVAAEEAGRRAAHEVGPRVRALLEADIDAQATTPLTLLREAVRYPTAVLEAAGVAPVERDDFSRARFPDDPYDLTPARLADVDPALGELGIAWGAAKAFAHKQRHGGPRR